MSGLGVPIILSSDEISITMEHIKGFVYAEIIDNLEREHITALFDWQEQYYQIMGCFGRADINLRNYLFVDGKCVGLDFEEISLTTPEQDYGRMLAFLSNYDPPLSSHKQRAAKWFIEELAHRGYDRNAIMPSVFQELRFMQQRRRYSTEQVKEMVLWFEKL